MKFFQIGCLTLLLMGCGGGDMPNVENLEVAPSPSVLYKRCNYKAPETVAVRAVSTGAAGEYSVLVYNNTNQEIGVSLLSGSTSSAASVSATVEGAIRKRDSADATAFVLLRERDWPISPGGAKELIKIAGCRQLTTLDVRDVLDAELNAVPVSCVEY